MSLTNRYYHKHFSHLSDCPQEESPYAKAEWHAHQAAIMYRELESIVGPFEAAKMFDRNLSESRIASKREAA